MSHRLPSLSALRAFEAAARLGSFKQAADELSVTPTAISHQIKSLENQLKIKLFVRSARMIELTESGRIIAPTLSHTFHDIRQAINIARSHSNIITLSTTPSFAALFLVPRLVDFYQLFPQYSVQLHTSTKTVDLRENRNIDLSIRYGGKKENGLAFIPLLDETFGVYGSPELIKINPDFSDIQLIETRWQQDILSEVSWERWMQTAGISNSNDEESNVIFFDEELHMLQAAIAAKGIALASSILVKDYLERGLLQPVMPAVQLTGQHYEALFLEINEDNQKIRDFLNWLKGISNRS